MGGHSVKGQSPRQYRPSATRRASGLSPINEAAENARRRWNKLRKSVYGAASIKRNIKLKGEARRGRFVVKNGSPPKKKSPPKLTATLWKNTPAGIHFFSGLPYKKGRFTFQNIQGFVPWPKTKTR